MVSHSYFALSLVEKEDLVGFVALRNDLLLWTAHAQSTSVYQVLYDFMVQTDQLVLRASLDEYAANDLLMESRLEVE